MYFCGKIYELMEKTNRIYAVDALRGFAVMGIILLHNIEHFNFYSFPAPSSPAMEAVNSTLWDMLFFLFSGKAYAMFALLFGLTFYIMDHNAERRGIDFRPRYARRLVALLGFGFINALFFPGEILVLYALLGWFLLPVRRLSTRWVLWIALILMLQPVEWCKVAYAALYPEANPQQMIFSLGDVYPQLGGESLWEMMKVNFVTGQLASLNWAWCYGRVFQTVALFMLGMLLGREGLMHTDTPEMAELSRRFWTRIVFCALPLTVVMYFAKELVLSQLTGTFMVSTMRTILNSWYNLGFMLTMAGGFLLLYWATDAEKIKSWIVPYGRMSLTDYVTQSVIGSFLYFGYGLALHRTCGTAESLCIGLVFLLLQASFARWWFAHYKRGPLETLWHRLTWGRPAMSTANR